MHIADGTTIFTDNNNAASTNNNGAVNISIGAYSDACL